MDEEVQEANSPRFASSDEEKDLHEDMRLQRMQDDEQVLSSDDIAEGQHRMGQNRRQKNSNTTHNERAQMSLGQQLRTNQALSPGQASALSSGLQNINNQNPNMSRGGASDEQESQSPSLNQSQQYQQHQSNSNAQSSSGNGSSEGRNRSSYNLSAS